MKQSETPDAKPVPLPDQHGASRRPFLLTLLCLAALASFGLITLLLLPSLFYSWSFTNLINTYITGPPVSSGTVFLVMLLLIILYATACAGIILIWRLKRAGYFVFGIPVLLLTVYQLFQADIPILSTAILIFFLIGFGLFYRKYT